MTGLVRLPFRTNSATARPRSKSGLRAAAEARDSAWAQFVHPRLFKGNDCGKPSAAVHLRRPQRPKGATAASGETAGGRALPLLGMDDLNFSLPNDAHRMQRKEVGPDPVMMVNDPLRAEMRSVADRMTVGDCDHFEAQRRGRTERRIDAEVGGPSCHQQTIRA